MDCCPNCGHSLTQPDQPRSPAQRLEQACRDRSLPVTIDGRVSEQVAAELLGRVSGTLANWAYGSAPLAFVKIRGRRTYRLTDIAEFIDSGIE